PLPVLRPFPVAGALTAMPRCWVRLITAATLATFVFANVVAVSHAGLLASQCRCPSQSVTIRAGRPTPAPQTPSAGCKHCRAKQCGRSPTQTAQAAPGQGDCSPGSARPCPNHDSPCPTCPCPGGCASCSVAKVPCHLPNVPAAFESLCWDSSLSESPFFSSPPFCFAPP